MPYPIERKLVVAVSSRAVFDLEEANEVFVEQGVEAYRAYQRERLDEQLAPGVAFPFVKRLLALNDLYPSQQPVEVVVLSRNSPDTGRRFFRSCRAHQLDISRGAFLSGQDTYPFVGAFNASVFLSANADDVVAATKAGLPAGLVLPGAAGDDEYDHEFRIAFDFDGVLADDQAEIVYGDGRLDLFHQHEVEKSEVPHDPGPLKDLFTKIGYFQRLEAKRAAEDRSYKPAMRVAIVTARNHPAEERLVTTLNDWGMSAAELFLMGGIEKKRVLEVFKPHIFFDDQRVHLDAASAVVPSVWIPFGFRNKEQLEATVQEVAAKAQGRQTEAS
nr:5'-nucleotidase [uncultured Caldimonas sp.]